MSWLFDKLCVAKVTSQKMYKLLMQLTGSGSIWPYNFWKIEVTNQNVLAKFFGSCKRSTVLNKLIIVFKTQGPNPIERGQAKRFAIFCLKRHRQYRDYKQDTRYKIVLFTLQ